MASRDAAHPSRRRHARTASAILTTDERSRAALNPPMYSETSSLPAQSALYNDVQMSTPGASTSRPQSTATKIIHTMRRQLSLVRRREADYGPRGHVMYSTPEERTPSVPTFMRHDDLDTRPTPEQIAMGLHLSRTPHIRPLGAAQSVPSGPGTHIPRVHNAYSPRRSRSNRSASPIRLPPPPARSSLRKTTNPVASGDTSDSTSPSTPSLSGSTATSTAPSTPRSSRAFFPLKIVGIPKFLNASRASSISDSSSAKYRTALAADSASEDSEPPSRRKSVRFTDPYS